MNEHLKTDFGDRKEGLNELALFAGGGLGLWGSKLLGWRTVCYVENDPYCVEVLKARISDGYFDRAPIWDDVRTFDGKPWAGRVDIITAGFPCQPWSTAGKRQGEHDERNLWPDTVRIIREIRPRWCLLENVPALLSKKYIQRIFGDLAESGYDAEWDCIPASFVGAPHIRKRLWILAHAQSFGEGRLSIRQGGSRQTQTDVIGHGKVIPDAHGNEYKSDPSTDGRKATEIVLPYSSSNDVQEQGDKPAQQGLAEIHWWAIEPGLGRVADGVPHRVDRLRAIGNGQVPGVVRAAWKLLNNF